MCVRGIYFAFVSTSFQQDLRIFLELGYFSILIIITLLNKYCNFKICLINLVHIYCLRKENFGNCVNQLW